MNHSFPSKRVLKTVRLMVIRNRPKRTISMGLGCYKWYQSQILGDVPMSTLGSQGGGL